MAKRKRGPTIGRDEFPLPLDEEVVLDVNVHEESVQGIVAPSPTDYIPDVVDDKQGTLPQEDIYEDKIEDMGQEVGDSIISSLPPEQALNIQNIADTEHPNPRDRHTI